MKRPSTIRKERELLQEFNRLSNIKEYGVSKHSFDWIIRKLANEFHFEVSTLERKIRELVKAEPPTILPSETNRPTQ
jgi:hypothetical protein